MRWFGTKGSPEPDSGNAIDTGNHPDGSANPNSNGAMSEAHGQPIADLEVANMEREVQELFAETDRPLTGETKE